MAERSLARKFLTLPRLPVVGRAIALAVLVAVVGALGVYLYSHESPAPAKPEEPELTGEITAVFENFRHLETEGGKDKYLLTAAVDRVHENGSHELTTVELISFDADGKPHARVNAGSGIYNQSNALVVFKTDVKIATTDGLTVETDKLTYNQETKLLEMEGKVAYARSNLEGTCRDALLETESNRLKMFHDVDMTFRSTDEKPGATAITVPGPPHATSTPETKKKKNKEGKKHGGKGGKGGKGGGGKKHKKEGKPDGGSPSVDFANGPKIPVRIRSGSAFFDKNALTARYEGGVVVTREQDEMRGATMVGYLTDQNRFRKIESRGDAYLKAAGKAEVTSPSMDFVFAEANQLERAIATGGAKLVSLGDQPRRTVTGDTLELDMAPGEKGSEMHQARVNGQSVVTIDAPAPTPTAPNPATRELKADKVTLDMYPGGQFAKTADAEGNAVLTVTPLKAEAGVDRKRIAAPHLQMEFFEEGNRGRDFHADGGVKVDMEPTVADGRAVRTTTSSTAEATFDRESQTVARVEQSGDFKYVEGDRNGIANQGVYTASDEMVALRGQSSNGRPTVWDSKSRTQADEIDIYSKARTSQARGDVRTTYYSPESTGGAAPFGKTKSPVFLTAQKLDARQSDGGVAVYTGQARAWQDDNYVKADVIRLNQDAKRMEAEGNVESGFYRVARKTEQNQPDTVPVFTTAARMTYTDTDRLVHYEGNVFSRQTPDQIKSDKQDVWLTKGEQSSIDRMIADGNVLFTEPGRTGKGDKLVYTAVDQKAVLTGTNARVEDDAQGSTTGSELTFYVGGERIRVTGRNGAGRVKTTHRINEKGGGQQ